jgi:hypothetical protein
MIEQSRLQTNTKLVGQRSRRPYPEQLFSLLRLIDTPSPESGPSAHQLQRHGLSLQTRNVNTAPISRAPVALVNLDGLIQVPYEPAGTKRQTRPWFSERVYLRLRFLPCALHETALSFFQADGKGCRYWKTEDFRHNTCLTSHPHLRTWESVLQR